MDTHTILVTGATGNVGQHVAARLRDAGHTVLGLTRQPSNPRFPAGVTPVPGDLTDPASVAKAAAGADAAFLLWPFLSADGAQPAVAALAQQVPHIVYLSAMSVSDDAPAENNGIWGQVEQVVLDSGAEWTFLRPGGFAANTLAWAGQIAEGAVVRWAYGQAARSVIHERDIADVAVLALTGREHRGAKHVLTGPEVITQADQARIIGEVTGRPVRWEEAPPEEIAELMTAFTGDREFAEHAVRYWASLVSEPEPVTRTVEQLTGHPARTFREWAQEHADAFRPA